MTKPAGSRLLDRVRTTQNPYREEEQRPQKRQDSVGRNAHYPERQQNQPHKRISNQRQQGNRPAEHQQETPQEKSSHGQQPDGCTLR